MGTLGGGYRAWFREPLVNSNDHTVGRLSISYCYIRSYQVGNRKEKWLSMENLGSIHKLQKAYVGKLPASDFI